jgi:predicted permease
MARFLRRLGYLLRQRAHERELAEEIESHRAMSEARLRRDGLADHEAAARSRRTLGNLTLAREDARAVWIPPTIDSIHQDVRYALRTLAQQPGFTCVAVGALAAGIGLNTAFFTIFNAAALRPWPVQEPERVVNAFNMSPGDIRTRGGGGPFGFSLDEVRYFETHARTARGFVAVRSGGGDHTLGDDDTPASWVSGNYFTVLGVRMAYGRGFQPHEDRVESPAPVAVLSHAYWRRRYGADPDIVGRKVEFEDVPFTVVGVAAESFTGTSPDRVDVWIPLAAVPLLRPDDRWVRNVLRQPANCCLSVAARLAPGATHSQAQAELTLLDRQYRASAATPRDGVIVSGTQFTAGPRNSANDLLVPMFGGVLLVLLLACANVGNLLIARGAARGREIAVRLSVGASRARVVRQLLTESAVLALLGGAGGVLVATWLPARLLRLAGAGGGGLQLAPDARVLGFALAVAAVSTLIFGLAPALHATRATVSRALGAGTHAGNRLVLRNVLLGIQVCAATVLLVSAGLLVRAIYDATHRDLGYAARDLTVVSFEAPPRGFDAARARAVALQLATDLDPLAGSGRVALTSTAPLGSGNIKGSFRLPGGADDEFNSVYEISGGYFELLGVPVLAGRALDDADRGTRVIVVNETMARRFWTVESAVGQRIVVEPGAGGWNTPGELEIVGVAGNMRMTGFGEPEPMIYQPLSARGLPQVLIRADDRAAADAAIAAASRLDGRLRSRVRPLIDNLAPRVRGSRVAAIMAGAMGSLALVLASVGMFGVFAYWVQQRTREIGVRMALGARGPQVVAVVVKASAWAIGAGAVAGAAGSVASSRLLGSYLFGLNPLDPIAYGAAVLVLGAAGTVATYWPARRATRIEPVVALRTE